MRKLLLSLTLLCSATIAKADHLIIAGGPALRQWEDLRIEKDRHDRWWANFIRASSIRMDELRAAYGPTAKITWIVYKPGYQQRSREDGKPYTTWIEEVAAKRNVSLQWITSGPAAISAMNGRPAGSVQTFDFFGHSNKHCWMLDYGTEVMAASKAWIHENDLHRINSRIFAKNASCQSWGCHTGESMSARWKSAVGNTLIGAKGPTNYQTVSEGKLPKVSGSWAR